MEANLLVKIEAQYKTFSKRQKLIADYILRNYDKAAFMTASALGQAAGVSESTVVRFACTLGYDGYPRLQKQLQEAVKRKLTTMQRINLMEGMSAQNMLDSVLKMDTSNIKATRQMLDVGAFERAVDYLVNAKRIYVTGYRSSAPLAEFLVYYLNYIFDNVKLVSAGTSDIYAQLMHAKEDDVVVAIGFPRYAAQTVDGVRFAKRNGVRVIAITDNETSPLYALADLCIIARTEMNSFVDSLVAPMSIINALVVMAGVAKKEQMMENFKIVEQIWQEKDIYVRPDSDITLSNI